MRLMFLTSKGLGGLSDYLPAAPRNLRLLFVPTASDTYDNPWWLDDDRKSFSAMGFAIDEIDIKSLMPEESADVLNRADIVHLAGGNTFYLLHHLNESGFGEAIKRRSDLHVIGGSAGAVVAGPDIAPVESLDDPTVVPNLRSTVGLGLVPFVVLPHYNETKNEEQYKAIIDKYSATFELMTLTDTQAVVIRDGQRQLVESL